MRTFLLCFLFLCHLGYAKDPNVVAVIGGGPAGLSAAITCQELGFQTILFDQKREMYGNDSVSFWPGVASPKWGIIIKTMRESFIKAGGTILEREVVQVSQNREGFSVETPTEPFSVKALIIATGKHPNDSSFLDQKSDRILTNVWSLKTFSPQDSVLIIGEGEPLFQATLKAARTAGKVTVFPYPENTVSLIPITKLYPTVTLSKLTSISDIGTTKGKAFISYFLNGAKLYKDGSYLIVAEESIPSSQLVENLCSLDSAQAIVTANDTGATSLPGLFACGEVTRKESLPGIQASADGQKVGLAVSVYLIAKGISPKRSSASLPAQPETPPQSPTGATGAAEAPKSGLL